ncbi:MAG: DUF502 domain-containing protein [Bacteroidales bacterium]|nr:DUF502 domain-containing protein [Bacteroidales bacterium]
MKKFFRYFLQGLLYIAPIGITAYIIYFIFKVVDGLFRERLIEWFDIDIPGLGLIVVILFLFVLGFMGQTIIARPFKKLFRKIMERAPLVKLVYSSLNDLFKAFVGKEKKFNKPVLVKVNTISNLEKMGFMTQEDLSKLNIKDKAAVYFPHSYNFSGEMFIVPVENITPLDIPASEAMKFIVSGGVTEL